MNPWHEKLGCEVNVCGTSHCDKIRMSRCALRRAWQERMAYLKLQLLELHNSKLVREVEEKMRKMQRYD